MRKIIPIIIILIIAVGGGAFYGGIKYQQSKTPRFQNLSSEQRQQFSQERAGRGIGAGFLTGEVITKDEQSLTLKIPDGSSKIVFFSGSTEITKSTKGSLNDLEIGKTISINGTANQDGSITANSIQLR